MFVRLARSFASALAAMSAPAVVHAHGKDEVDATLQASTSTLSQPTYVEGRYGNPWPTWERRTIRDILQWQMFGKADEVPQEKVRRLTKEELDERIPVVRPDMQALASPPPQHVQVTWVGHATALVQMEGVSFLTDPVWAERASPLPFGPPKRIRPVPLTVDELPKIDFVVVSHDHYDHLDISFVQRLGNKTLWIAPKGFTAWFNSVGITNVVELNWWEKHRVNENIEVVCLPCQHWCKRTLRDDFTRLWGSWGVIGKSKRVYFSGDTGYCPAFKEIGQMYGPFDLSLIAIGAYLPRWFMRPQHIDPADAVMVHKDIKSRFSLGIHWGTFILTEEPEDEPPKKLQDELKKAGVDPREFVATKIGETVKVP